MCDEFGDSWERKYFETLNEQQRTIWISNRPIVKHAHELIDYGNLVGFARKTKFFDDLVRNGWKYFTKFNDINEARNMIAHHGSFDKIKFDLAFAQMLSIARELQMTDLEESLKILQKGQSHADEKKITPSPGPINPPFKAPNLKQRPKKRNVINLIYNTTGIKIDISNVNLSTINSNGIYSVEPNFDRPNHDWHLILINTQKRKVFVFNIPAHHKIYSKLYTREDKNVFRLLFDIDDPSFREHFSHERFNNFLETECSYEKDALIF
jgi:hypothetical protein